MVKVTYIQPDGESRTIDAKVGDTVMSTAVDNGVPGIVAECGGSMACATCHCYVDDAWSEVAKNRSDGEEDMLDCALSEMRETSRLSCQIKLTEDLDGLVVHIPEDQV